MQPRLQRTLRNKVTLYLAATWFSGAALLGCVTQSWAQATAETQEVSRLLKAGQFDQAISRADAFLASKPKDAQMRFLKGLILTEQKKTADAIQVFTRLTEDYPELPEPYNNLAVLYAVQGQYEKARTALEMAIRTHPSYATAHENLGDVYAKLASQAYDKALQLDSNNPTAQTKLSLARDLIGGGRNRPTPAPASKPVPIAATTATPSTTATTTAAAATVTPNPSATTSTTASKAVPAGKSGNADNEVLNAVNQWARAWSNQDMKTYLAAYGPDFVPPKGVSRKAWEQDRVARIEGKRKIEVTIQDPKVEISGSSAIVKFRQIYRSKGLNSNARKTLHLSKTNGKWLIKQEKTGN